MFGSSSEICDSVSGECPCLPNVVGRRCEECAPGYYGFGNGLGCRPCNCDSIGASSTQCDSEGSCQCQPGIAGSNCDQCLIGYFNFTANGCQGKNDIASNSSGACNSDVMAKYHEYNDSFIVGINGLDAHTNSIFHACSIFKT